jgi:glutamate/tyrosine decarboxylase-like PLP-dependent enzyme
VAAQPGLELLAPARLNIVCFRFAPAGLSAERTDALNREAVAAIRADGRAFVSGTVWQGKVALRAAFDNWATSARDVALLQEAIAEVGGEGLGAGVWEGVRSQESGVRERSACSRQVSGVSR